MAKKLSLKKMVSLDLSLQRHLTGPLESSLQDFFRSLLKHQWEPHCKLCEHHMRPGLLTLAEAKRADLRVPYSRVCVRARPSPPSKPLGFATHCLKFQKTNIIANSLTPSLLPQENSIKPRQHIVRWYVEAVNFGYREGCLAQLGQWLETDVKG